MSYILGQYLNTAISHVCAKRLQRLLSMEQRVVEDLEQVDSPTLLSKNISLPLANENQQYNSNKPVTPNCRSSQHIFCETTNAHSSPSSVSLPRCDHVRYPSRCLPSASPTATHVPAAAAAIPAWTSFLSYPSHAEFATHSVS